MVEKSKKEQETAEKVFQKAVNYVMNSYEGRYFLRWLLDISNAEKLSFRKHNQDHTVFNEGKRLVGLTVLDRVEKICPEKYLQLLEESVKEKQDERRRTESRDVPGGEQDDDKPRSVGSTEADRVF